MTTDQGSICPTVPDAVAACLTRLGIVRTGIVVGVSGGADSVGLVRALDDLRQQLELDVCVAHLDHGLRAESSGDAEWVQALAAELRLPAVVEHADVQGCAAETQSGIEETARRVRYEFLCRIARERNCSYVAVAHTADDQAETILHHLLRGTGLTGLRGMPETRPLGAGITLVRPILSVLRAGVLGYLGKMDQSYRADATNDDHRFTRNRLRHSLLPLLQDQFNSRAVEAIVRLGRQVADVQTIVEDLARSLLDSSLIERQPHFVVLHGDVLRAAERHLVREAMRLLWTQQNWPRQRMGFDDWDRLATLVKDPQSPTSLDLPHRTRAATKGSTVTICRGTNNSAHVG